MSDLKKKELGQFFTRGTSWMRPHITAFINSVKFHTVVDPFAGDGDLLKVFPDTINKIGYDIDSSLSWPINDSLSSIPKHDALCVTNPPYLAKVSSSRMKNQYTMNIFSSNPGFDDLYLIGLHNCINTYSYGIAIIPETYQLSPLKSKRLISLTILEDNPFIDTAIPVVVICWGPDEQDDYEIYCDDLHLGKNSTFVNKIPSMKGFKKEKIKFNDPNGNLGIRGIDDIRYCEPSEIKGAIKESSRAHTKVTINTNIDIKLIIDEANRILTTFRKETYDTQLAPFKGNKDGKRRRRLDFSIARAIIETALVNLGEHPEAKDEVEGEGEAGLFSFT
jgi:hypothetical protein